MNCLIFDFHKNLFKIDKSAQFLQLIQIPRLIKKQSATCEISKFEDELLCLLKDLTTKIDHLVTMV